MKIRFRINDQKRVVGISPNALLIDVLRQEGFYSVKHGCETGECGSCAVVVNGKAVNSCVMLAAQVDKKKILTLEGIGTADHLHPLQQAFIDHGAIQCGYCTPGMILSAKALLDKNRTVSEEAVRDALAGNLCRCTGYLKPVEAVLAAAEDLSTGLKNSIHNEKL